MSVCLDTTAHLVPHTESHEDVIAFSELKNLKNKPSSEMSPDRMVLFGYTIIHQRYKICFDRYLLFNIQICGSNTHHNIRTTL